MKKIAALAAAVLLLVSALPLSASAETGEKHWVSAWSTSPVRAGLSELGALDKMGVTLKAVSSRVCVTPTVSGSQARLVFSNEYGVCPLNITGCTLAPSGENSRCINVGRSKNVLFDGKSSVTIPAGKTVTSDPVELNVAVGEKLTVTTYFHRFNAQRTIGLIGGDSYAAIGDYTHARSMLLGIPLSFKADSGSYEIIPSLKAIEVLADGSKCSCVFFGDSTIANEIPRLLEKRLRSCGIENVSVTQQAIKGNRLVADGVGAAAGFLGEAGVERFERDVLSQAGVKYVIVKLGVNDIVHPYCKSKADRLEPVSFEEMTAGYVKLCRMAHEKGVKIFLSELSPWKGYTRNLFFSGDDVQWSEEIDAIRLELNEWMAGSECPADGYLSFPGMADPADGCALRPEYTTDGAHLTDAGQLEFVNEIPLSIFG